MQLINIENAKKQVKEFYTKQNILSKTLQTHVPSNDILKKMPYVYIPPLNVNAKNMYPHVQPHQHVSHEILYNDHVFRNTTSNSGLGYFSIR